MNILETHVFSQHPLDNRLMGYSVRSMWYWYTEWVTFNKGTRSVESYPLAGPVRKEMYARERYDYGNEDIVDIDSPGGDVVDIEYLNVMYQPEYENISRKMMMVLHAGSMEGIHSRVPAR